MACRVDVVVASLSEEEFRSRINQIETWANTELAKFSYFPPADPKPGTGEPGYLYGYIAAEAYRARFSVERAEIAATMEYLTAVLEASWYEVDAPESPSARASEQLIHFLDIWGEQ